MLRLPPWLRPPRNRLILFGVVLFLPAAALITLGVRLLEQDRALARQRQSELLEHTADQVVRTLSQDLVSIKKLLVGPQCTSADIPEDAVCILIHEGQFESTPPQRVPYYPSLPPGNEPTTEPFRKLEALEFGQPRDLRKALEIAQSLTTSTDNAIRAGALLREARILKTMAKPNDALASYATLGRLNSVSVNKEPIDLLARRARCSLLEEQSRKKELHQEAESIAADLRSARWKLDRETYLHVAGLVGHWIGTEIRAEPEQVALAAGLEWLHQKRLEEIATASFSTGVKVLLWNGAPVTILWESDKSRIKALIVSPRFLATQWLAPLQQAAFPARAYLAGVGASPPAEDAKVQRTSADTGLPWSVAVAGMDGQSEPAAFTARRHNLFAAMAAVLVLVAAGSYFLWLSVNRDLAVARLQSDFVSAVSHEFRTPLTALRQFNELLADEDGPTPEKRRRYYEAQTRATERLHRLVESLLDFARMEEGLRPYRFDRLDAGALARDVTDEFRREAVGASFAITCNVEPAANLVTADREALSRALWNLLDNAVKYSGDRREIEIEVKRGDSLVAIGVRDHGIGISTADQDRIFQKFVRGAAATAAGIKGTGLGLAMVRHIVDAHGGTVTVSSAAGEGSKFTIALPIGE